jgi:hypothetical protein
MVQIDVQVLSILAGVVIPILVGVITKLHASRTVKAILNFGLSATAGGVAAALAADPPGSVHLREWVLNIAVAWVVSVATYYGLWKPTGAAGAVQTATAGFGVGSDVPAYSDDIEVFTPLAGTTPADIDFEQLHTAVSQANSTKGLQKALHEVLSEFEREFS